jgi:hypothetical protein
MTKIYFVTFLVLIFSACSKDNSTSKSSNTASSISKIDGTIDGWINSSNDLYLTVSMVDTDYFNNIISQSLIQTGGSFSISINEINSSQFENIDEMSWWYDTKDLVFSNKKVKSVAFSFFDIANMENNLLIGYVLNSNYPDSLFKKLNYEQTWYIYVSGDISLSGKERDTVEYDNNEKDIYEYVYDNIKLKKGWNILYYKLVKIEGSLFTNYALIKPTDSFLWRANYYNLSKKSVLKNRHYGKTKRQRPD